MKLLGKVDICGVPHNVWEASEDEDHQLEGAHGYYTRGKIMLSDELSAEAFLSTAFHEIQHAVWDNSGMLDHVAAVLDLPRTHAKVNALEELLIRIQTPHLIAALKSLKTLKVK